MRFIDYKKATYKDGDSYIKPEVMIVNGDVLCIVCKQPTHFLNVFEDVHLCSDECEHKWYFKKYSMARR